MLGLQDPMLENNRVLENETVNCLVENLREMAPGQRTAMVAQIVPFLGALLAEIIRAINLAQLPATADAEIVDDDEVEEDDSAMIQLNMDTAAEGVSVQIEEEDMLDDERALFQQSKDLLDQEGTIQYRNGDITQMKSTSCSMTRRCPLARSSASYKGIWKALIMSKAIKWHATFETWSKDFGDSLELCLHKSTTGF